MFNPFKRSRQGTRKSGTQNEIIKALETNKLPYVLNLIDKTENIEDILTSPEAQPGIEKLLGTNLRKFSIDNLKKIIEKINPSKDILESPQIKTYALDGIHTSLRNSSYERWEQDIKWFLQTFNIEQTDLKSLEIQALVEKRFLDCIKNEKYDKANFLREIFTPRDKIWKERIEESLCSILKEGDDQKFKIMLKQFPKDINQDVLESETVIGHAKLGIKNNVFNKKPLAVQTLSNFFGLNFEEFPDHQSPSSKGMLIKQAKNIPEKLSRKKLISLAEKIKRKYPAEV